ncbi:MAG: alpha-galactosidase [Muribaculum sp.]|nr:alpha-galactosidase [Muribaculaceae bacterium]MCM1081140.1 alpha-galactosidase [Muribaculum sp.]
MLVSILATMEAVAFEQELTTDAVGKVRLVCENPGKWTLKASVEKVDGKEEITIVADARSAQVPPQFTVEMQIPQVEIHHLWCGSNGDRCPLLTNWGGKYKSNLAFDMPLYTYMTNNNLNRLTVVSNEPLRHVTGNFGLREEGCDLVANLGYFSVPEAPLSHYETKILLDTRPVFWAEAVRDGADWMTREAGIIPIEAPESAFDPLYSSWYQFHQDVFDKDIEAECRRASALGMKTLIIDDGWQTDDNGRGYAYCGDWEVSKNRFPDFASHIKKVQDMGMKYMLWYSVPFIGKKSKNYTRFQGKYLAERKEECVLDPRFPEVREFLYNTYETALREWNLDGFKLDFIDSFKAIGEDPAVAENYAGRDIKSVPEAVDVLMTGIYNRLKAIKPDILIEFRQNYIGPAIRQYGNMLRALDCAGDMQANRKRIGNLRLTSGNSAVHADMIEWNPADTPEHAARHILSALFGVIQYSMHLGNIPADHGRVITHWLDFSQKHRTTLLKSDFRPYHPESCYPLIEAENDDEMIVAVYDDMTFVPVAEKEKPVYVINATGKPSVIMDLAKAPKRVEAFNTFGEKVNMECPAAGVGRAAIPESGYAILYY